MIKIGATLVEPLLLTKHINLYKKIKYSNGQGDQGKVGRSRKGRLMLRPE